MSITAADLVASRKHILLDFDGPICAAFAGYGAANISGQLATLSAQGGASVPAELFDSPDPFELLRYAVTLGDLDLLADVDAEFRRLEIQAVRIAPPTPDAIEVISTLVNVGHTVTIVSNNSTEAVEIYARHHQLAGVLGGLSARTDPNPTLLKPNPHLLLEALQARGASPTNCIMVRDSISDIEAAHQVGITSIAFANKPAKNKLLLA